MKHLPKLLLIILITSCASSKVIELGEKAASKGKEVSQEALDIYTLLSQQADLDKSQQDKVKVLTNPDPAKMELPKTKAHDLSIQIEPRIKAYQSLLKTYEVFSLLTDKEYADKTEEAVVSLQESFNSIQQLPDLPESVSSKLSDFSRMLTKAIQAKKIKSHNQLLSTLTSLYILLWEEDQKIWEEYIDRIYDDYSNGLNTVSSNIYDPKKISERSDEPYKDESVIILMYRLEKRDEIIKQKNDLKKQLSDFGKALKELNKLHTEISKSKIDISEVVKTINSIENLLKQ